MHKREIESWALEILQRTEKRQPVEDSFVELKREWPDVAKSARQLAGHANAARGEPILWLIGVDEKQGKIVGANPHELSNWLSQLKTWFNGLAPQPHYVNVPYQNVIVSALHFDTSEFPYVVKNPAFNTPGGGPVELEVPWREGNSTRSASRSDLVLMCGALRRMPKIETRFGEISYSPKFGQSPSYWKFTLGIYLVPVTEGRLTFPFHRCSAILTAGNQKIADSFIIMADTTARKHSALDKLTKDAFETIRRGPKRLIAVGEYRLPGGNELIITGPCQVEIDGNADSEIYDEFPTLQLTVTLIEAISERKIVLSHNFVAKEKLSWELVQKK